MQIAMVGLGKMGANMTQRLLRGGHQVIVTDINPAAVQRAADDGATPAESLAHLVAQLEQPRVVWVMVPAGDPTEHTLRQLSALLAAGDIVIDGGNSNYKDTVRRAENLSARGIFLVDSGTSGGVWGLTEGYSLMIGGDEQAVKHLTPIFETLAPAPNRGWGRVGRAGAGHFAKMIHNGIEYGMMQAFAEGFGILEAKKDFAFDLAQVAQIWQHGSVVRSWLLDLIADALLEDQDLDTIAAYVPDSGEGRWTVFEAIDLNVSAPVIMLALERRIRSREDAPYADKLLSVMRNQFGGHSVKKSED